MQTFWKWSGTALAAAFAVEAQAADLPVYTLDAVVVTAARIEQKAENTPAAVETITAEDIVRSGAADVRDVLAAETNLFLNDTRYGGHNVMIRGMDTDKALILVNGRRVANEASAAGLGNAMALSRVNLFNVDRIEIVRGPASALYGSEAMGGVINIITKTPDAPEISTGLEVNSDDTLSWWRAATGQMGRWFASFDAKFDKYRRDLLPSDDYSGGKDSAQSYQASADYAFDEESRLHFWTSYFSEHMKSGEAPAHFTSRDYRQENYGLSWDGKTERNSWTLEAYASRFRWASRTAGSAGAAEAYDFNRDENRLYHAGARDTLQAGAHHRLTFGAEYEENRVRGTGLGTAGDSGYTEWDGPHSKAGSEKTMETWAAYVQDEMTYGKWLFLPAVRYDHHSVYGDHTSPKLGVTYRAGDHFRVKGNYGEGFKAPSVLQLYYDMEMVMPYAGRVHLIGNPALRPETSKSWDIGIEAEAGKAYTALTYFDNDVTNLIDSRFIGMNGDVRQYRYENVDRARIRGVEHTVGWRFNDRWETKVVSTWLDAKDSARGTDLPQRAKWSQVYQLIYDDHKDTGWSAMIWDQFFFDYVTEGFTPGSAAGKTSYNLLNVTVTRKFNRNSRLYGSVRNALDRTDADCGLDGRFWSVGISHSF